MPRKCHFVIHRTASRGEGHYGAFNSGATRSSDKPKRRLPRVSCSASRSQQSFYRLVSRTDRRQNPRHRFPRPPRNDGQYERFNACALHRLQHYLLIDCAVDRRVTWPVPASPGRFPRRPGRRLLPATFTDRRSKNLQCTDLSDRNGSNG